MQICSGSLHFYYINVATLFLSIKPGHPNTPPTATMGNSYLSGVFKILDIMIFDLESIHSQTINEVLKHFKTHLQTF